MHDYPIETSRCGLFDTGAPNFHTYYPDVAEADFVPKDGDFVQPLVRALSEVVVHKEWNPVDFSQNEVLQNSKNLLYAQSIYVDHETSTGNVLGSVAEVFWEKSYKSKEGFVIPSGLNARLKLDGKSHPNFVRKIQMDPPAIHSLSVTVQFAFEPSHPKIPLEEFYSKLGTYDQHGEMYRRIATQIKSYKEISFVPHGADPYAQLIREGQITNPRYADVVYNNAEGKPAGIKYYIIDFKEGLISNSQTTIPKETNYNNDPVSMNKILLLLAATLGIATADKDEAALIAEIEPKIPGLLGSIQNSTTELATTKTSLTEAQAALTAAQAKVTELEAKQTTDPALVALGQATLTEQRAEILRLSTLINGKADPAVAALIESSPAPTLALLLGNYKSQADEKFPISCKACGSHEVSRQSSKPDPKEDDPTGPKLDLRALREKKTREEGIARMHGKEAQKA